MGNRVFWTYAERTGRKADLPSVLGGLSEYNIHEVFSVLSRLNSLVGDERTEASAQLLAIRGFLPLDTQAEYEQFSHARKGETVAFHRRQLLMAMKLLALNGRWRYGRTLVPDRDRHRMGNLLLKLGDYVSPPTSDAFSYDLIGAPSDVACEFMASLEMSNPPDPVAYLARYYQILFVHLPAVTSDATWSRWMGCFRSKYGCAFEDAFLFAMGLYLLNSQYKPAQFGQLRPGLTRDSFFSEMNWSPRRQSAVLNRCCLDIHRLPEMLLRSQRLPFDMDFEVFRRFPVIRDRFGFFITDLTFLLESAGQGLLSDLEACVGPQERQSFRDRLGKAFEAYVKALLAESTPSPAVVLDGDDVHEFPGQGKRVDAVIRNLGHEVAFEAKIDPIASEAKYGRSPRSLHDAMAGLNRHTDQIAKWCAFRPAQPNPPDSISPVYVSLEAAVRSFGVGPTMRTAFARYLARQQAQTPSSGSAIHRLSVFTIEELEKLCHIIQAGVPVEQVLMNATSDDPSGESPDALIVSRRSYDGSPSLKFHDGVWAAMKASMARHMRTP